MSLKQYKYTTWWRKPEKHGIKCCHVTTHMDQQA